MPDLLHVLQGNDLGFLRIIAGAWGIELTGPDAYTAAPVLARAMLEPQLVQEVVETLPADARQALIALLENDGLLSWAIFSRRFGEVRPMGAARRDRERPDLKPASPAEVLWYRGLIGKAFINVSPEPQEFTFVPEDLLEFLQPYNTHHLDQYGRLASPAEMAVPIPASDRILDDACTLLAALRLDMDFARVEGFKVPAPALLGMLQAAHLVDASRQINAENVRLFLEMARSEALAHLAQAWMNSPSFNELRLLKGLRFEGDWMNDPLLTRQVVMELLSQLPQDAWWSLPAFVAAVHERRPDFQRPAGDYDSWFIRREVDGAYLRGFASWDEVDGALLRFLICGPMHWLGLLDLSAPDAQSPAAAFRPSAWAAALWHGSPPEDLPAENGGLRAAADGRLAVTRLAPRSARYQLARFCQWDGEKGNEYLYRLTPTSLERAFKQGLKASHLLSLLRRYSAGPLPPTLLQAVEQFEKFGVQAAIEKTTLLRLGSPEMLTALQRSRANRYLAEVISPTTVAIKPGGEEAVRSALAELGCLADFKAGV